MRDLMNATAQHPVFGPVIVVDQAGAQCEVGFIDTATGCYATAWTDIERLVDLEVPEDGPEVPGL